MLDLLDTDDFAPAFAVRSLDLCACCALLAANGDTSGCRDYYHHDAHALSLVANDGPIAVDRASADINGFHTGVCDGCGRTDSIVALGSVVA